MEWFWYFVFPFWILGMAFTATVGGAMLLVTRGTSEPADAKMHRQGARILLLSPVWPILVLHAAAWIVGMAIVASGWGKR